MKLLSQGDQSPLGHGYRCSDAGQSRCSQMLDFEDLQGVAPAAS